MLIKNRVVEKKVTLVERLWEPDTRLFLSAPIKNVLSLKLPSFYFSRTSKGAVKQHLNSLPFLLLL